jgi:hypothetical protein
MRIAGIAVLLCFSLLRIEAANSSLKLSCSNNLQCSFPRGQCQPNNECVCSKGWASQDQSPCNYPLKSKQTAFLLSFLLGFFGADWFYLSVNNIFYILAGILKLITCGGWSIGFVY